MSRAGCARPLLVAVAALFLLGLYCGQLLQLFPNERGLIAGDYGAKLPLLLDGYYWFLNNGLQEAPWFTPSLCGGIPQAAHPASLYFSFPQLATFLVDPLSAVRATLVLFAALGFGGTYVLLRRVFEAGCWTALLGGTLFLYNGFSAARMIVGHLEFHGVALVPWVALWVTLPVAADAPRRIPRLVTHAMLAGASLAYMFVSGLTQLMIPSLLAVLGLAMLAALAAPHFSTRQFAAKLTLAGASSLALSASKLVGVVSLLRLFGRESYALAGIEGPLHLLEFALRVLSVGAAGVDPAAELSNVQVRLDRHELEYGVTLLPFALIAAAGGYRLWVRWRHRAARPRVVDLRWAGALALLLLVPLALNFYTPSWNALLERTPVLESLTTLFRWWVAYVPLLCVGAALALDRTPPLARRGRALSLLGMAAVAFWNAPTPERYPYRANYDPGPILAAWEEARQRGRPPRIRRISVHLDEQGRATFPVDRNDSLVRGESELLCYDPIFGVRSEFFPRRTLRPGPTLARTGAWLNLKNPACYLYPEQNHCLPGDHFRVDERHAAERFVSYRPFPYETSAAQRAADAMSRLSLISIFGWLLWEGGGAIRSRARSRPGRRR